VLAELQDRAKLGGVGVGWVTEGSGTMKRPSDEVEGLKFVVKWETSKGAFGVKVSDEDVRVEEGELSVVSLLSLSLSISCFFRCFFEPRWRIPDVDWI